MNEERFEVVDDARVVRATAGTLKAAEFAAGVICLEERVDLRVFDAERPESGALSWIFAHGDTTLLRTGDHARYARESVTIRGATSTDGVVRVFTKKETK